MKLTVNEGNIDALKVAIAALEAKENLEIIQDNSPLTPCLSDDTTDLKLFMPNVACRFLHESKGQLKGKAIGAVDWILEWELTSLRPVLIPFLQNALMNKKSDELKSEIQSRIKAKIMPVLDQSQDTLLHYPGNNEIVSVADIVVWCDLYPLYSDRNLSNVITEIPRLKAWMDYLNDKPSFQAGLQSIFRVKMPRSWAKWAIKAMFKSESAVTTTSKPEGGDPALGSPVKCSKDEIEKAFKAWNSELKIVKKSKPKGGTVLPEKGRRNVLITSALPYVNNVPHLGNIVGAVLSADVFARFCRLRGYNTLYICGTDEYGTSTETKAIEEGLTPRQICDKYNALHSEIYEWFDIGFDKFGRTTTELQTKVAQDIFWQLHKAGNLSEDAMDQLFCKSCDRFLADRFVEGHCPFCNFEDARGDQCDACGKLINAIELKKPRCKLCNATPEVKTSKHVFIDLPKIEADLNTWLEESSKVWTNNARVIAKSWLRGGLQPRCITRDLKWGTPVPLKGYETKVFYVWFDAPIGYISITANYTKDWEKWWKNPDEVVYYEFMAKDNVPFHSVVFPATLLGTGDKWTMVNHLMSTEYLNYEDAKFSKSRGIGVFGSDAKETGIPADIWRFYLIYTRPENADSAFKWEDLMHKNNSELLANLGNFVNRALKFCNDQFAGTIGKMALKDEDKTILAEINRHLKTYVDLLEKAKEREAISQILNISRIGNQLMQSEMPWKLVKSKEPGDKERAACVVSLCVNISCLLAVLVEPFMPNLSRVMLDQMNTKLDDVNILSAKDEADRVFKNLLKEGHKIGTPSPLIREIKPDEIAALKERFKGRQASPPKSATPAAAAAPTPAAPGPAQVGDPAVIKDLEDKVAEQGNAVRKLKEAKAEKDAIKTEVDKLLELKKQLALAQGLDPNAATGGGGGGKGKKKKK